jgi:hypothetical protein
MSDETESKVQAAGTMMMVAVVTFALKDAMTCQTRRSQKCRPLGL